MSILFNDSNIEIFKYDSVKCELYSLSNSQKEFTLFGILNIRDMVHPDDIHIFDNSRNELLYGLKEISMLKLRIYNKEAEAYCYYDIIIAPIEKNRQGHAVKYVFSMRDCTADSEKIKQQNNVI